jgi:hypothetical protein
MASVKITELNPSGPLTGSEVLPIVQGNETVKTTVQEIGSFTRPYKVYTALLTQSGGDDPLSIDSGLLTLGVTYVINNDSTGMDFTNVGAPNNNLGISFVATGTTPSSWGANEGTFNGTLVYNTGAPVVTVLENTIGNIWFTYNGVGYYQVNSNELFTADKTTVILSPNLYIETDTDVYTNYVSWSSLESNLSIITAYNNAYQDSTLNYNGNVMLEIRVYN